MTPDQIDEAIAVGKSIATSLRLITHSLIGALIGVGLMGALHIVFSH